MFELGLNIKYFNPRILYIFKKKYSHQNVGGLHSHENISLIYIISGECMYYINGNVYGVKKGDLIILNPEVIHGKDISVDDEVTEFHVGFTDLKLEYLPYGHLIGSEHKPVIAMEKYDSDFVKCFSDILLEQKKNDAGTQLILKTLVMKLIVLILRELNSESSHSKEKIIDIESYDKIEIVSGIVSYITDNYTQSISLDNISQNMYLSPVYISKIFKDEIGESPINYLIKTRLSKACELLEKGELKINEVAKNVGYNDAYHFSKLFKKYYGIPPSKYKA